MEDACAYIEFILKSIKSRDFFHSIQIEPDACWECLWWMDQVGESIVRKMGGNCGLMCTVCFGQVFLLHAFVNCHLLKINCIFLNSSF